MKRKTFFKKIASVVGFYATASFLRASDIVIRDNKKSKAENIYDSFLGKYQNEINEYIDEDRPFLNDGIHGMGVKVIKPGNNLTTLKQTKTKYIIRYDFNLNKSTWNVPADSILVFDGGSIKNGCIIGSNTTIVNNNPTIFGLDVTLKGSYTNDYLTPDMFGIDDNDSSQYINKALLESNNIGKGTKLLNKDYQLSTPIYFQRNTTLYSDCGAKLHYSGEGYCLNVVSPDGKTHMYPTIRNISLSGNGKNNGIDIQESRKGGLFENISFQGFNIAIKHSDSNLEKQSWLTTFNRLIFRNNKIGISLLDNSNGVHILNSFFINGEDAIKIYFCSNVSISKCEIENHTGIPIQIERGHNIIIEDNYFENNATKSKPSAVVFIPYNTECLGVKIESNYFNITSTQYGILVKSKMVHMLSVLHNVFYTSNKDRVNLHIDKVSENHVIIGNYSTVNNNVLNEVSTSALCRWGNLDYANKSDKSK